MRVCEYACGSVQTRSNFLIADANRLAGHQVVRTFARSHSGPQTAGVAAMRSEAQVRGWPAECPAVPLHRQGHPKIISNRSRRNDLQDPPLSGGASAPPPPRCQGPGGSLPGPDAGHPLHSAGGHEVRNARRDRRRRARSVPDRTVISGTSRSFTDTPHRRSPARGQVRRPGPQSCKEGVRGSSPLSSTRQNSPSKIAGRARVPLKGSWRLGERRDGVGNSTAAMKRQGGYAGDSGSERTSRCPTPASFRH